MRHESLAGKTEKEIDALYDEMRDISAKLHIPTIEAVIAVSLIKPDGEKIEQFRRHSRSFTRNMYVHHTWRMSWWSYEDSWADGSLTLKSYGGDTIGNSDGPPYVQISNIENGLYGYRYYGHYVGSDNTAEGFEDYTLGAEIPHGNAAGQLLRGICRLDSEGWTGGGPYYWSIWDRDFDNNSGNTIDVYEFCTIWRSATPDQDIMWSRDVEAGGVAVPNGDTLHLSYEHRISFP